MNIILTTRPTLSKWQIYQSKAWKWQTQKSQMTIETTATSETKKKNGYN